MPTDFAWPRLLLTNGSLQERRGTELFTRDLAISLRRAGCEVSVFAPALGEVARELRENGVQVTDRPEDCPRPELIHGQHHLSTMAALAAWPGVPAVYFCHGFLPWEERAPVHPRIGAYLTTSPRLVDWLERECGIRREMIRVIPNFVDLTRFSTSRTPPQRPARAIVFGNRTGPDPWFERLTSACASAGVSLDAVGLKFGNATDRPESILPGYDIAFACGRAAIEAMACGCAVMLQSDSRCGEMVTPDRFDALRDVNFALPSGAREFTAEQVASQLERYDADSALVVSRRVRETCGVDSAMPLLAQAYRAALLHRSSPEAESAAISAYLAGLHRYLHHGDTHFERLQAHVRSAKAGRSRALDKLAAARAELKSVPSWLRKLFRHRSP